MRPLAFLIDTDWVIDHFEAIEQVNFPNPALNDLPTLRAQFLCVEVRRYLDLGPLMAV